MATPIKFAVQVEKIIQHSEDVNTIEFRYLNRRPRYKPGQFIHLALDPYDPSGHWPESRVFTIAKGATARESIRLTIAKKGKFTARIFNELKVGKKVWMKGPYGEFIINTSIDKEIALIAGGTGVSPFVAFMEDGLVKGMKSEIWLHYGCREEKLLIYRDLANRCAAEIPSFNVKYYTEKGGGDNTVAGKIDIDLVCKNLKSISKTDFYLCGPEEMIKSFSNRLSNDYHVPSCNIKLDKWE